MLSGGTAFAQPAVTIQPPNASGAVAGTLPGTAGVGTTGAATYSIPLAVPPGTAQMAPGLSLIYSSQADRGLLARGWAIGGLSAITRCPRTVFTDGVSGAVTLTSTDQFCLDGQRLVLVAGTHGASAEYRTQLETFSKVVSTGSDPAKGPDSWQVFVKGGLILTFGGTSDATIEAAGRTTVLTWEMSRAQDRRGNYFDLKYFENNATGEHYPVQIRYTGNATTGLVPYNAVNFVYQQRPDSWTGYVAGTLQSMTQRLTGIQTVVNTATDGSGGTLVRDYRMAYSTNSTNGRSLLATLTDCDGSGSCLSPTTFTWTARDTSANTFVAPGSGDWGGPAVSFVTPTPANGAKYQQVQSQVLMGDVNGDGAMDLLTSDGSGTWKVCLGGTSAFTCQNWTGPANTARSALYGDFNGDGLMDIAIPPAAGATDWNVCLSTGSSFSCSTWTGVSVGTNANYYLVGDFNGDGRDDIIAVDRFNRYGGSKLCQSTGSGFQGGTCSAYNVADYIDVTTGDFETGPRIASRGAGDFNGDGRNDLFLSLVGGTWMAFLATDAGLTTSFTTSGGFLSWQVGTSQTTDQNGDRYGGYGDVIGNLNGAFPVPTQVCRSTGIGFQCDSIAGTTGGAYHVADADGDGRPDVYQTGQICQLGESGPPFQSGTPFGSTVGTATVNFTCAPWTDAAYPADRVVSYSGDFNGDGFIDEAAYVESTGHWIVHLGGNGGYADLLATIVDGVGRETRFTYKGTNDATVYSAGAATAYPKRNVNQTIAVVSQLRDTNAVGGFLTTDFNYKGRRIDLRGLGSIGFESVTSVDQTNGITTVTTFNQDYPFISRPTQVKATQANGTVLSQNDITLTSFASAGGSVYPYAATTSVAKKDLDGSVFPTVTTSVNAGGIDAFGNITSSTETITSPDGDVFTTATTNTYDNLTANWLIGLLRRSSVTRTAQQAAGAPATPPTLFLTGCSSATPTTTPVAATMSCTVANTGQSVATAIAYASPSGTTVTGPGSCAAATANCGTVTVVTSTSIGSYSGNLTATPTPAGSGWLESVALVVSGSIVTVTGNDASALNATSGGAAVSGAVTFTNTGNVSVSLAMSGLSSPYSVSPSSCTAAANGGTCSVTVSMATSGPLGAQGAQTLFATGGSNGPVLASISGTLTGSVISLTANGATALSAAKGGAAATGVVTFTNNGNIAANLSLSGLGGPYSVSPASCAAAASGGTCSVTVSMASSGSVGAQGSQTLVATGGTSGPVSASVTGTVTGSVATLTSAPPSLGNVYVGAAAPSTSATFRNDGNVPMTITDLAGNVPAFYVLSGNSCSNVAPGVTCSITVTMATGSPGAGPIPVTTSGPTVVASFSMNGTVTSRVSSWSVTSLAFGSVGVGAQSTQSVTLSNVGFGPLTAAWNGALVNLPAGFSANTSACGAVAVGSSCSVQITFAPTAAQAYSGSGIYPSGVSSTSNQLSVSGTGTSLPPSISVSPSALAFGSVLDTQTSVRTLTVTNSGGGGTLTIAFTGANPSWFTVSSGGTCVVNGAMAANSSCTINIQMTGQLLCGSSAMQIPRSATATVTVGGSAASSSLSGTNYQGKTGIGVCA